MDEISNSKKIYNDFENGIKIMNIMMIYNVIFINLTSMSYFVFLSIPYEFTDNSLNTLAYVILYFGLIHLFILIINHLFSKYEKNMNYYLLVSIFLLINFVFLLVLGIKCLINVYYENEIKIEIEESLKYRLNNFENLSKKLFIFVAIIP